MRGERGTWRPAGIWRELRNQAATYRRVRFGGRALRRLAAGPLDEGIAALYRLDPASTVFRLERLAYERTVAACRREAMPRGILAGEIPEKSLVLLHTGLGMGLAWALVRPLRPVDAGPRLDGALSRFADLCRANSRPGYERVGIEALGTIVRMFRTPLAPAVDRALSRAAPELAALFWHGAGRALYFHPEGFLPGGAARQVARCRQEAPAACRLDALSGLAFAATMVNLGEPEIVARRLAQAGEGEEEQAFAHGVATALVARRHTRPDDPAVGAFLDHRPAAGGAWEERVATPCRAVLDRVYPRLLAERRLDELARYAPLAGLGG